MDLQPYVENIQCELVMAAEAVGEDARALAERLLSPLDSAIRLTLQDALVAAVEEITCELAPGAVELRLRGRDPEFVVVPAPVEVSGNGNADPDDATDDVTQSSAPIGAAAPSEPDEGGTARINLRMPDQLKGRVEQAAAAEGISVNSWLVRAAGAALGRFDPGAWRDARRSRGGQRYAGWAR
jgi:hypothetical protein